VFEKPPTHVSFISTWNMLRFTHTKSEDVCDETGIPSKTSLLKYGDVIVS